MSYAVSPLFERTLAVVAGHPVTFGDTLAMAEFTGTVTPYRDRFDDAVCATAAADAHGVTVDEEQLQTALTQLRYDFGLISVEDTQRWLNLHDLGLDDVQDYLERDYWRHSALDVKRSTSPITDEWYAHCWPELLLSGALADFIHAVAQCIIARERILNSPPATHFVTRSRQQFCKRRGIQIAAIQQTVEESPLLGPRFAWCTELAAARDAAIDVTATPERCHYWLDIMRPELTEFEFCRVRFTSADAAREALLCVREDGEVLEAVAARIGCPTKLRTVMSRELSPELAQILQSIPIGECVMSELDTLSVYHLISKRQPTIDNRDVHRCIQEQCLIEQVTPTIETELTWRIAPQRSGSKSV